MAQQNTLYNYILLKSKNKLGNIKEFKLLHFFLLTGGKSLRFSFLL